LSGEYSEGQSKDLNESDSDDDGAVEKEIQYFEFELTNISTVKEIY